MAAHAFHLSIWKGKAEAEAGVYLCGMRPASSHVHFQVSQGYMIKDSNSRKKRSSEKSNLYVQARKSASGVTQRKTGVFLHCKTNHQQSNLDLGLLSPVLTAN